jgi:2-amino-4-hydroxy-6-hydroxymethyldihydropteridine diphosphokinase
VTPFYIGIGSNLGDREIRLQEALNALGRVFDIKAVSPLYETAPMYVLDQPAFLNGAIKAETDKGPLGVLRELKRIEREVGRLPRDRFGPREIDLDLIAFGSLIYRFRDESPGQQSQAELTLPHPRLVERRFVLQPLYDIAPDLVLPGLGSVYNLLIETNNQASAVIKTSHALLSISSPG